MIETAVQIEPEWQGQVDWEALAERAVLAAFRHSPHGPLVDDPVAIEVSVRYADDEEVRELNATYRDKDKPTNVLSFPMVQPDLLEGLTNSDDGEVLLGDIILARGVCVREADEKGVNPETHATHLIVHGTLHLLGFDHIDEGEAEAMEAIERAALASLGIADPYAVEEA
ncbi:probable rRNA maturation factor [Sphingomonas laterariae]|uniref:Endoribonuclease YbeY n=1 Tax=Edaphosphingomonas laterariae TaxID=861865 RepID=A0A239BDS6_9SPHN|nr:rRNA maturation RNase YbeY [Sphingomonas laterariae]SNS05711.1 probable rRNA maturation factor [Sphingomonas laterariae]